MSNSRQVYQTPNEYIELQTSIPNSKQVSRALSEVFLSHLARHIAWYACEAPLGSMDGKHGGVYVEYVSLATG